VTAIGGYDFPVILAMGMVVLSGVMVANLLADLLQAAANPRIRL
jgi:peptide/nickel transport system permease protein